MLSRGTIEFYGKSKELSITQKHKPFAKVLQKSTWFGSKKHNSTLFDEKRQRVDLKKLFANFAQKLRTEKIFFLKRGRKKCTFSLGTRCIYEKSYLFVYFDFEQISVNLICCSDAAKKRSCRFAVQEYFSVVENSDAVFRSRREKQPEVVSCGVDFYG